MGDGSDGEAASLLRLLPRWAGRRQDIRAVALVGSWANRTPRPDSDVDVLVLTEKPALYIDREDWIEELGGIAPVATQVWGVITERRFRLPEGLEVEFGVGRPSWASVTPIDAGTRRVATDGLVALYDPDGLLESLLEHCPGGGDSEPLAR